MLLPCVLSLPQLTRLALVDVAAGSLAKLRFLPTQLRELQLSLARLKRNERPPPGETLDAFCLDSSDEIPVHTAALNASPR
jgi:hypothetical protein